MQADPRKECFDKPVWTLGDLKQAIARLPGQLRLVMPTLWGRPLSQRFRELCMLAVATENRCGYCQLAHRTMGQAAGLRPAEIDAVLSGRDEELSHTEQLAVAFVRDLARRNFRSRSEALYQAMAEELSAAECRAVEATAHVMNFANRFGNTFDAARHRVGRRPECTPASPLDLVVVSGLFVPALLCVAPWIGALMLQQRLKRS